MTQRVAAQFDMRQMGATSQWVFPAPTATGHIEKFTLKKRHKKALAAAKVEPLTLCMFRHTRLTRWAAFMDPYTLAYLAGHSDFSTTRRYVHPQANTIKAAIEKARGGHRIGHSKCETAGSAKPSAVESPNDCNGMNGRGERIRTSGLLVPNQALYQAEPRPDLSLALNSFSLARRMRGIDRAPPPITGFSDGSSNQATPESTSASG